MTSGRVSTESVACDCCGAERCRELYRQPDLRYRRYEQEYRVVECIECGHRFLNPRPVPEHLHLLYPPEYYEGRGLDNPAQRLRYERQAAIVTELTDGPGRLLDFGCAGGAWSSMMGSRGWDSVGVDFAGRPDPQRRILVGELRDLQLPGGSFDVATAWGVMEHLADPSGYFREIRRLLVRGGLFVFVVPNGDSFWSRWAFKEDIPRHLHFFRRGSLRRYADMSGFDVDSIRCSEAIYTRPASGRGLFRRRLLRASGASWGQLMDEPLGGARRWLGRLGAILDRTLLHAKLEQVVGKSGVTLAVFRHDGS